MDCKNTLLDDISAEIGYTATTLMAAWHGGSVVHIPRNVVPGHPLATLLGEPAFARLVKAYPGNDLFIPKNSVLQRVVRWRTVRDMLLAGHNTRTVGEETGLTPRNVQKLRQKLEALGLLPVILTKPSPMKHVD